MRPASAALKAYLAANVTVFMADLYTFALTGGTVLRYSGSTMSLTVPAAGFPSDSPLNGGAQRVFPLGPKFGRSKIATKIGVEPAELDIEILAGPSDLVGTIPFADALRLGLFDGAAVELDRFFAPPGLPVDTSLGCLTWFYGRVADCDIGRGKSQLKVKSLMNLLAVQQMPRRLYQAACGHVFGDAMCGYDRTLGKNAAGALTGLGAQTVTAGAGTTQAALHAGFSPSPATGYDLGTVTGLTGANAGASRSISNVVGGTIFFQRPFLSPVALGDTFQVLPGCAHTTAACNAAAPGLNNFARYGGFPYIPPPEMAI